MVAKDILAIETLGNFDLDVNAGAQALIEYLSHPALNLIRNTGFDTTKLKGDAKLKVKLSLPLIKDVPKQRVVVDASAHISRASLKDALPGIDLTEGRSIFRSMAVRSRPKARSRSRASRRSSLGRGRLARRRSSRLSSRRRLTASSARSWVSTSAPLFEARSASRR